MKPSAWLLLLFAVASCGGEAPEAPGERRGPAAKRSSMGPEVGIELRRGREPRELVRIGTRSVIIGPEGGPREWKLFSEPRRADDAWYFFRSFAPFEIQSAKGDLKFQGHGRVKPAPAERRMILEWARHVATEAAGERGGAAYGLVLAWHQGGPAGICEDVAVYLSGEAVATGCGWDREVRGRLDPGPLEMIYGWFDRLQPFQAGGDSPQESLQMRMIFAGSGARSAKAAERAQIQSFAESLFAELAARRRGSAAPMPVVPRLLLPPGAGARGMDIVLQLPEKPPPRPRPRTSPSVTPGAEATGLPAVFPPGPENGGPVRDYRR